MASSFRRVSPSRAPARIGALALTLMVASSAPARADATFFLGSTTTPTGRAVRGVSLGAGLLVLGFEFEYASTSEDLLDEAPSLRTGMGNVYVQTPFGAIQFYALLGAGMYRERLDQFQETNTATAVGGGAKVSLAGPLRLRLDYRLFNLRGEPRHRRVHRVYAGLNVLF
jgi:opacity protein-like surface antigen